jgi:hypothetical protein
VSLRPDGPVDGDGFVTTMFRLPHAVEATAAHVVGEFNDWSETATPMEQDDDGFVATVPLEPGRRYRFRYLLDGERWENDWAADDYVPNEFGGTDSVIDLTGTPSVLPDPTPAAPPDSPPGPLPSAPEPPSRPQAEAKPKRARKKAAST